MKRIVQWFFCRICIFEPLREISISSGQRLAFVGILAWL